MSWTAGPLAFWDSCCRGTLPALAHVAPSKWDPPNGLMDCNHPDATSDLFYCGMEGLGTDFASGSAEPQLLLCQDWFKGHVTLETEKYNSTHSHIWVSESSFSQDIARIPLPLVTEKFHPLISPATLDVNYVSLKERKEGWLNITELYLCSVHRHILI